jgi:uncharacterized membrane protein
MSLLIINMRQKNSQFYKNSYQFLALLFFLLQIIMDIECKGGRGGGRGGRSSGRSSSGGRYSGRGSGGSLGGAELSLAIIFGVLSPYILFFVVICILMKVRKATFCEAICCMCCCWNCKNDKDHPPPFYTKEQWEQH